MKETKITKRIFAVFVAFIVILLISCGDLQVFADYTYNVPIISSYTVSVIRSSGLKLFWNDSNLSYYVGTTSSSYTYYIGCYFTGGRIYFVVYNSVAYFDLAYNWSNENIVTQFNATSNVRTVVDGVYSKAVYNGSTLYYRTDLAGFTSLAELDNYIISLYSPSPSPSPTPEPTPLPTSTPAPTFSPDQPTYTTFFNHLLNDGNNALNALYLSWTQANNKFYTGIFFIGLPIMIGIFGIVASIFFGGDD